MKGIVLASLGLAVLATVAFFAIPAKEAACFDCPKQGLPCQADLDCYDVERTVCILQCAPLATGRTVCLWQN